MRRLVNTWIDAEKSRGHTISQAINRLNDTRGMQVTHSRVSEWRRGIYKPSQVVLSYMFYRTLRYALDSAGVEATEKQLHELESLFWDRLGQNGQQFISLL